jgi:hypothetical protein
VSSGLLRRVALVRTQKTPFFIVTAVKTSNLTSLVRSHSRYGHYRVWTNLDVARNRMPVVLAVVIPTPHRSYPCSKDFCAISGNGSADLFGVLQHGRQTVQVFTSRHRSYLPLANTEGLDETISCRNNYCRSVWLSRDAFQPSSQTGSLAQRFAGSS